MSPQAVWQGRRPACIHRYSRTVCFSSICCSLISSPASPPTRSLQSSATGSPLSVCAADTGCQGKNPGLQLSLQLARGLYFGPKTIFILPPSENEIFPPSHDSSFFNSNHSFLALILPYFALILPFYFLFSLFLSPFLLFILHFPPFSLSLFIFFPPNDIG